MVDQFIEQVLDGLKLDRVVSLRGFGVFTVVRKGDRVGRNPKTGTEHVICSRDTVRFKAWLSMQQTMASEACVKGSDATPDIKS